MTSHTRCSHSWLLPWAEQLAGSTTNRYTCGWRPTRLHMKWCPSSVVPWSPSAAGELHVPSHQHQHTQHCTTQPMILPWSQHLMTTAYDKKCKNAAKFRRLHAPDLTHFLVHYFAARGARDCHNRSQYTSFGEVVWKIFQANYKFNIIDIFTKYYLRWQGFILVLLTHIL